MAWARTTLSEQITRLLEEIKELHSKRSSLVAEAAVAWDIQFETWFTSTEARLSPKDFQTAVSSHLDIIGKLGIQGADKLALAVVVVLVLVIIALGTQTIISLGGRPHILSLL